MVTISQQRQLDEHGDRLGAHDVEIRDMQLWRAEVGGILKALMYIVGIGMGLPATAATIYALINLR